MPKTPSHPGRRGRVPIAALSQHDAALVEAAGRLFREHGYPGVTIDLIARAAGVSPKTIYARYGGKHGLFEAVIASMVREPVAAWEDLDARADPGAELRRAADRFLQIVLSPEVLAMERVLVAEATRLPELAQTFYEQGPRRGLERLATFLRTQAEGGRLVVADPERAAEAFIGLIEGELARRALFLDRLPGARERRAWLDYAVAGFVRAHGPAAAR